MRHLRSTSSSRLCGIPWERAVSIASYFGIDFPRFASDYGKLTAAHPNLMQHALPLHCYTHFDGRRFVNFIGRFETLQLSFNHVMDSLNLNPQPLGRLSQSNRRHDFREYYDQNAKRLIDDIYRRDAELFGYEFDA